MSSLSSPEERFETRVSEAQSPIPEARQSGLWRHRDFMKLWSAQTISVFGSQFTGLAIPIIAALTLQATPAQMGILTAVEMAPFLLIGLFAGVWVDRLPRRPVLIAGDIGRGVLLLTIPVVAFSNRLAMPQLYVIGFLVGVLTVFFDVAYQAYLPSLVDRQQLVEGNSRLEATRSLSQLTGPGIAGIVIQMFTAPVAIILDAVSFFASGALIGAIRKSEETSRSGRGSLIGEVREGLAVVFGSPLLRSIAACTGTSNFFSTALFTLYILFATRDLGLTPAVIGLIFSIGNIAGLVGVLVAGRIASRIGVGWTIVGSSFISGVGLIPVTLATREFALPLLVLSGLLTSFGVPVYNINQVSLRQAMTAQRLQGRMNATMRFLVWGTMPLGGLAGGALGEALGLRGAIAVAAFGELLAFLWVLFSPVRSLRRIPEPVA